MARPSTTDSYQFGIRFTPKVQMTDPDPLNIVPNPSGEATDNLTKLQIGTDIFNIKDPDYDTTAQQNVASVPKIKEDLYANAVCKNVLGEDYEVYYPLELTTRSFSMYVETSDGSNFSHSQAPDTPMRIGFYDANKELIVYQALDEDQSSVLASHSLGVTRYIKYIKLNVPSDVPLMVAVDVDSTPFAHYQPYFYNARQLSDMIMDLTNRLTAAEAEIETLKNG